MTATGLTLIALGIAFALAITRATLGPTAFDRVLAVNTIGTLAVLAISVYGFFDGRPEFLDIALLYALINFLHHRHIAFLPLRHAGRSRTTAYGG